jgi:hypothetical protein
MTVLIVLGLLFIVAGVAGIAGWGVNSRDSRFSLWPLHRAAPNEFRRRDPKRPDAAPRRPGHRAALPERGDAARDHLAHRRVARRHLTSRAATASRPQAPASKTDRR